jgi:hypothetical protein
VPDIDVLPLPSNLIKYPFSKTKVPRNEPITVYRSHSETRHLGQFVAHSKVEFISHVAACCSTV